MNCLYIEIISTINIYKIWIYDGKLVGLINLDTTLLRVKHV